MRIPTLAIGLSVFVHTLTVMPQRSAPRRTDLGTQMPRPALPQRGAPPRSSAPAEAATAAIQRAMNAHGGQNLKNIADSVAEGTLTLYGMQGPHAQHRVTIWRKGQARVQRIIQSARGEQRQGADGARTWDNVAGFVAAARGPALEFLETQTTRALPNLFDYQTRGSRLRDDGLRGPDRVLTIEETNGRTTTYVIDGAKSVVTRLELVSGQAPDMLGQRLPIVQAYVFSNFRTVQGVATPFTIEHFTNGIKIDEMVFTSIRYNTGVSDEVFHP